MARIISSNTQADDSSNLVGKSALFLLAFAGFSALVPKARGPVKLLQTAAKRIGVKLTKEQGYHGIRAFSSLLFAQQAGNVVFEDKPILKDLAFGTVVAAGLAAPIAIGTMAARSQYLSRIKPFMQEQIIPRVISKVSSIPGVKKSDFLSKLFKVPSGESVVEFTEISQQYRNFLAKRANIDLSKVTGYDVLNLTTKEYKSWVAEKMSKLGKLGTAEGSLDELATINRELKAAETILKTHKQSLRQSLGKFTKLPQEYEKRGIRRLSASKEIKRLYGIEEQDRLVGFTDDILEGLSADTRAFTITKGSTEKIVNLNKFSPFRQYQRTMNKAQSLTAGIPNLLFGIMSGKKHLEPMYRKLGQGKIFIKRAGTRLGDIYKQEADTLIKEQADVFLHRNVLRRAPKSVEELAKEFSWSPWRTRMERASRFFGVSAVDKATASSIGVVIKGYKEGVPYVPLVSDVFADIGASISRNLGDKFKFFGKYKTSIERIKGLAKEEHLKFFGSTVKPAFEAIPARERVSYSIARMLEKPFRMAEELGLGGLLPATRKTPMQFMSNLMLKRLLPLAGLYHGIKFTDFASRQLFGVGPLSLVTDLMAGLTVAGGYMRDVTGVTAMADYVEGLMPGSITSPASKLVRRVAFPFVFRRLAMSSGITGNKGNMLGLAVGISASFFFGGDLTSARSGEQLMSEYFGEEEVPIKKGRWWEFGKTPFEGGKIQYYRPNWYRLSKSKYKEQAMYGSEWDYWKYGTIFSPGKYLDPYKFEKLHYADRPYLMTEANMFTDVPLIGSLLSPISGLIKPRRRMHPEYWTGQMGVGIGPGGTPIESGGRVAASGPGIGPGMGGPYAMDPATIPYAEKREGRVTPYPAISRGVVGLGAQTATDTAYRFSEWIGFRGFMAQSMFEKMTGAREFQVGSGGLRIQTPDYAKGFTRSYWDLELGGLGGLCFVKGTKIVTSEGRVKIEDVVVGDRVISIDGNLHKVVGKLHRKSDNLYKVRIKTVDAEFTSTWSHRIPIFKKQKCRDSGYKDNLPCIPGKKCKCSSCKLGRKIELVDIKVQDLKKGDYCVVPILPKSNVYPIIDLFDYSDRYYDDKYIYSNHINDPYVYSLYLYSLSLIENKNVTRQELRDMYNIPDSIAKEAIYSYRNNVKSLRYDRYTKIDADLAYVLGWWVAEGHIDKSRVDFTMSINEIVYADKIIDIVENRFGCKGIIIKNEHKHTINIRINSVPLSILCKELFKQGACNKEIPYIVKTLPEDALIEFFKGLVLGDGWATSKKAGFHSASSSLVRDLYDIGLSLGFSGNLVIDYEEKGKGLYPQGTPRKDTISSYINWDKVSSIKIYNLIYGKNINIPEVTNNNKSFIFDNKLFVQVDYVEKLDSDTLDVYDVEVEDFHYYMAEHIVVHNTEFFPRRFWPRARKGLEEYNPIRNMMPEWLPGEDYFLNFQAGDPYTKIPMGEARLPGRGYEELHGVSEEDMTPLDRFSVLADVAPYSKEYKLLRRSMGMKYRKDASEEKAQFDKIVRQVESRYDAYEFAPRKFTYPTKETKEDYNLLERAIGRVWEGFSHMHSPLHTKLLHKRSALEEYKRSVAYGRETSFWSHPVRDFLRPMLSEMTAPAESLPGAVVKPLAMTALAAGLAMLVTKPGTTFRTAAIVGSASVVGALSIYHNIRDQLGGTRILPKEVQQRELIEEHFDKLKYVKYSMLESQSRASKKMEEADYYSKLKNQTLIGTNPYGYWMNMIGKIPKKERAYFKSFLAASSEEREEIFKIIPSYMKPIYQAQWEKVDLEAGREPAKYMEMPKPWEYKAKAGKTAPAVREELEAHFDEAVLPDRNWVGWNPLVDLDKVKLRSIQHAGLTPQDFNFWDKDIAELRRMPYVPYIDLDDMRGGNIEYDSTYSNVKRRFVDVNNNQIKLFNNMRATGTDGAGYINYKVNDNYRNIQRDMRYRRDRIGVEY